MQKVTVCHIINRCYFTKNNTSPYLSSLLSKSIPLQHTHNFNDKGDMPPPLNEVNHKMCVCVCQVIGEVRSHMISIMINYNELFFILHLHAHGTAWYRTAKYNMDKYNTDTK